MCICSYKPNLSVNNICSQNRKVNYKPPLPDYRMGLYISH